MFKVTNKAKSNSCSTGSYENKDSTGIPQQYFIALEMFLMA